MDAGYVDRWQAGALLAGHLSGYAERPDTIVLGLVRGGVPVAAEVARRLTAPLDVLVIRKLGAPWAPELAFGALGPGGVRVLNESIAQSLKQRDIARVIARETAELNRQERLYRADREALDLTERTAIVVDDGLATGATARAAVEVCRAMGAARVVVAVPVGSGDAIARLAPAADEVVCPLVPTDFGAVSRFYQDFRQVTDDEVRSILKPIS